MRLTLLRAALLAAPLALAGCNYVAVPDPKVSAKDAEWMALMPQAPVEPGFGRYLVDFRGAEAPGTIIVETGERQLYYVLGGGKAVRYGVAVGDEAYGWKGAASMHHKAEWPDWNPPAEMIARWPHVHPVRGGPNNPLGARALYLFDAEGKDTLYRIHGTNEPEKIGQAVSSGCIRMRNLDVVDLYNRAQPGAVVIVR